MAKKKKAKSAKLVVEPLNKYVIEIGLDSRVAARPDGTYPHLMSLVKVENWDDGSGDPWWFTNFRQHDAIVFRVCDYTGLGIGGGIIDVKGIVISFLLPQNPRRISQDVTFNDVTAGVICSGENYFPLQEGSSLVMAKELPCWRFIGIDKKEKPYWLTGKGLEESGQGIALLRVSVTALVSVEDATEGASTELRCFTHDPEIIVGVGGDGSYESPRRRPSSPRRR